MKLLSAKYVGSVRTCSGYSAFPEGADPDLHAHPALVEDKAPQPAGDRETAEYAIGMVEQNVPGGAARQKFLAVTDRFAGFQAQSLNVHVDFPLLQRLALPVTIGSVRYPGIKHP